VGIKVVKLILVPTLAPQEWGTRVLVVGIEGVKLVFIPTLAAQGWGTRVVVEHAKNDFGFLRCGL